MGNERSTRGNASRKGPKEPPTNLRQNGEYDDPPWWYRYIPEHIKTFFLRDIKILHEEDSNKAIFTKQSSRASFIKVQKQKQLYKFILHPESQYRLFWDIVTALLVLVLIWLIPFYIGFNTWSSDTMNALSVFMDVWFICDVFLNFRTGFVDHGATIMDSNKIAKHYLKSWFVIDFFASVPWEVFVGSSEEVRTGKRDCISTATAMSSASLATLTYPLTQPFPHRLALLATLAGRQKDHKQGAA